MMKYRRVICLVIMAAMILSADLTALADDVLPRETEITGTEPAPETMEQLVDRASQGHVRCVTEISCSEMRIYRDNGSAVPQADRTVPASDYIPVRSTDIVSIICSSEQGGTDVRGCECYLYFYDADKRITWDILDVTDPKTGEKNRMSIDSLRRLNGFQFTDLPDGTYVRIAGASVCDCWMLIWDGESFGYPVSGSATVFNDRTEKVKLPQNPAVSVQLPGTAWYVIARPGYTILSLVTSNNSVSEPVAYSDYRFPAQAVYLRRFRGADRAKNICVVKGYNYETGEYESVLPNGSLSEALVVIDELNYRPVPPDTSVNGAVFENISACMDFTWECMADVPSNDGSAMFRQGVTYHGVPYRSSWTAANNVGWHVSRHTFMNAANDPDSIFYHNPGSKPGPYYCLVCSSFATLVEGFPYPITNYGMMMHPQIQTRQISRPQPGSLLTNGTGHCVIPIGRYEETGGKTLLTLAEQIGPLTAIRNVYPGINSAWKGIGAKSSYPVAFAYQCTADAFYEIPYDIMSYTITNGSARPYRGDRSVYTSDMDVLINIKDAEATRLYYQQFDVECTRGIPTGFTPCGEIRFVDIAPGTVQVNLRSRTEAGGVYAGAELKNGAVYGVWAGGEAACEAAPANTEYFEWYDLGTEKIVYSVVDGKLVTNDEFWYIISDGYNEREYIQEKRKSGLLTIAYEQDGDYSAYARRAQIDSEASVHAVFRKGKFGAYVTGKIAGA